MYKIKEVTSSIYHLEFTYKHDMFLSLARCEEFYECQYKNIRGKKFSMEDLIETYWKNDSYNDFNYFNDFSAFNFPDTAIINFLKLNGDTLTEREKKVFDGVKKLIDDNSKQPVTSVYFVATYKNNNKELGQDFKHELAHGLFYIQPMYKKIMTSLLKDIDTSSLYDALIKLGYCDEMLIDEAQAYLATSTVSELKDLGFSIDIPKLFNLSGFRETFLSFASSIKYKRKRGKQKQRS